MGAPNCHDMICSRGRGAMVGYPADSYLREIAASGKVARTSLRDLAFVPNVVRHLSPGAS